MATVIAFWCGSVFGASIASLVWLAVVYHVGAIDSYDDGVDDSGPLVSVPEPPTHVRQVPGPPADWERQEWL